MAAGWSNGRSTSSGRAWDCIVLAPLFAAVALLVVVTSRGPAFFTQQRIGRDGKPFTLVKFRSMCVDAEQRRAELLVDNDGDGVLFKLRRDPRVTRVGRRLRRLSIDELPQLVNVLRGQMSLVGPRPPLPSEVAQYEQHVHRRLLVTPGLTGLWQVNGRSALSWEESVRLDLYYVENWSVALDAEILWKTVFAVLRGRGAPIVKNNFKADLCSQFLKFKNSSMIYTERVKNTETGEVYGGIFPAIYKNLRPELQQIVDSKPIFVLESKVKVKNPFETWWEKNIEPKVIKKLDEFKEDYQEIAVELVRTYFKEDSSLSDGVVMNSVVYSTMQEARVYSMILEQIMKQTLAPEVYSKMVVKKAFNQKPFKIAYKQDIVSFQKGAYYQDFDAIEKGQAPSSNAAL